MTASLEQALQNLLKKSCISALMQKNSDKGRAAVEGLGDILWKSYSHPVNDTLFTQGSLYEPVQPTEA